MKKPELLAPCGNMESLIAAVQAGCDAVYLSGKRYGARTFASNFSNEELVDAIKYCHLYGVKVYVTVNTIIYEDEVNDFINYIDFIHLNNVDALIMQDIGMVDLVRKLYPNLEIHISTQMHVHNLEGVKFFENLGVKRVVLARETSIDSIKMIKEKSNMDIEVFVHGALCISYSGQCLMSSLIGGRSANRGACAGCCRLPYDLISDGMVVNTDKYLLSTRDLMTLNHISELIESGIDSFKIEGRMKRPEYVYQIVSLYRKAIDSYFDFGYVHVSNDDILSMKKIFNREFTDGFLFNERKIVNSKRPNHMGVPIGKVVDYQNGYVYIKLTDNISVHDGIRIVGNSDVGLSIDKLFVKKNSVKEAFKGSIVNFKCDRVLKDSTVLKTTDFVQINKINDLINSKSRKVLISGLIKLSKKNGVFFELTDGFNVVSVSGGTVLDAINSSISREQVIKQINRLGGTVYRFEKLDVLMDDNVFVPVSTLNELRRNAVSLLNEKRLYDTGYLKGSYSIELKNYPKVFEKSCLVSNSVYYHDLNEYDYIYVDDFYSEIKGDNVFYKIPRVNNSYKDFDSRVLVGEVGSLYRYKNVDTDFSFNVVNSYSVAFLHSIGVNKITLSYELDLFKTKKLIDAYHERYGFHPNLEVIVEAREEVMVCKYNLLNSYNLDRGFLRDRFGNLYPIRIFNDLMYIYNYKKRKMNPDDFYNIGINVVRINF